MESATPQLRVMRALVTEADRMKLPVEGAASAATMCLQG